MGRKFKVLVVDDSQAMRGFLQMILSQDPALEVVGLAQDPYEARELIKRRAPDVITLDVEMPRMDGITFLKNLMRLRPIPVVMLSSLTAAGAEITLDALAIGAIDFVLKQQPEQGDAMKAYANDICTRVRNAAATVAGPPAPVASVSLSQKQRELVAQSRPVPAASGTVHRVIALGASTGGPVAVTEVLSNLRLDGSCVVLSQHMPGHFMAAYAQRLDRTCPGQVVTAQDGAVLQPGVVYVAPGDRHLLVRRRHGELQLATSSSPKVNDHRPSVDVMFESVADTVGPATIGVLLTGMGNDGASGMCRIRERGGVTVAQDESTSVVWGMPGSAVRAGGADTVEPLGAIGALVSELGRGPGRLQRSASQLLSNRA